MFETMVGVMRNRPQSSPAYWGLPQSCTEGFWSEIPRRQISWPCGATLKMSTDRNYGIWTKIDQNRDFGQNFRIFYVLIAVNYYKHTLLPLGFVWDVLCVFCTTKTRRSIQKTVKIKENTFRKRIQNRADSRNSRLSDVTTWGRPQPLQGWF